MISQVSGQCPFGQYDDIAQRLIIACAKLRLIASQCQNCNGRGHTGELWEWFLLTDDPRKVRGHSRALQERIQRSGGFVEPQPRGAARLLTPCPQCRDLRIIIKMCEAES